MVIVERRMVIVERKATKAVAGICEAPPSKPSYSGVDINFGGWPGTIILGALPSSMDGH